MIKIYSSDEKETSLLVETGSYLEAKKLEKELLDAFYNNGGKLEAFRNTLLNTWCIDRFFTIAFEEDLEGLEAVEKFIKDKQNSTVNESASNRDRDEPTPFEDFVAVTAACVEDVLNERGIHGRGHDKYLDAVDAEIDFFKPLFIDDLDEEEAAKKFIDYIDQKSLKESLEVIKASGKSVTKE